MRCLTPQIAWHNKEPILSVDFDPTTLVGDYPSAQIANATNESTSGGNETATSDPFTVQNDECVAVPMEVTEVEVEDNKNAFYRFASGGADSHLLVWHMSKGNSFNAELHCVADLTRHMKAVNVVRFSPDGRFIASADDDAYVILWKCEEKTDTEEVWMVQKVLRRHLEDISDISWSKDSKYIVSGSVDNAIVLWDIQKGSPLFLCSEHDGFVQGVAYDPLGEFVVSICTDRTLRLFNTKDGRVVSRALKYPKEWLNFEEQSEEKDSGGLEQAKHMGMLPGQANRIFHDETLRTFYRRLEFSPKGEILMIPGAILPPSNEKDPTSPGQKKAKASINSTVVFCRNSFTNPCAIIPCGSSFSVACRFCPIYFRRNREVISYGNDLVNSTKKSERIISCVGKLKPRKMETSVLMNMPYRIVYAIATANSVIIGDTESPEPLAVIGNIHCTRLTDLSWSKDGRVLLVSSSDGFCTLISFEENELGTPYPMDSIPDLNPDSFAVQAKKPPAKATEGKKNASKGEKISGESANGSKKKSAKVDNKCNGSETANEAKKKTSKADKKASGGETPTKKKKLSAVGEASRVEPKQTSTPPAQSILKYLTPKGTGTQPNK